MSQPFMGYPQDHVLGIFDARDDAAHAIGDLREAGFEGERVSVLVGEEGAAEVDTEGTSHGFVEVAQRAIEGVFTDHDDLQRYDEAIRAGKVVVAVEAPDDDEPVAVADIFKRHDGYEIYSFGSLVVQQMDADPSRIST